MSVCDKRCGACQYPDCVNDEMDLDDYREADARDRALGTVRKAKDPPPVGGDAAKKEAARERDKLLGVPRREKCSESAAAEEHRRRALAYYRAHAAEINAKRRGNPRIKEQHRAYYLRHREEILARQKEYNRRRAAEKRAARER